MKNNGGPAMDAMENARSETMQNLLLQTTIEGDPDDWNIGRFGLLKAFLAGLRDESGQPAFRVTARNRDQRGGPDSILSRLDESDFQQLWLFAVDVGDGLTEEDCAAIGRFRRNGASLLVTRDHMDLGSSVCTLASVQPITSIRATWIPTAAATASTIATRPGSHGRTTTRAPTATTSTYVRQASRMRCCWIPNRNPA